MSESIKLLDVVALTADFPEKGLIRGHVGTIVEELAPGVYEVEFTDSNNGEAYALLPLKSEHLLVLRYAPAQAA